MHTTKFEGIDGATVFNHHGDYSGEVVIKRFDK